MSEHHHGFDFYVDQEFATCVCGLVITNPYYQVGWDEATRQVWRQVVTS